MANHNTIKNGISYDKNGWLYISVKGSPRERGYAYGYLCAPVFKNIQKMLKFSCYDSLGETWEFFIDATKKFYSEKIKENFPEFYEEIQGIAEGCCANGTPTTTEEILTWNNYFTIVDSWYSHQNNDGTVKSREGGARNVGASDRCSAFIAVGDYTEDGKIVVAHNSFSNFIDGQYMNVILDLNPTNGHRMIMQTSACWIWSGTDFFVTDAGIIGTETTIGGFNAYENKFPIAFRIRKAMQYGNTIDDYIKILLHENSGDYANSWLFGDVNTNEIVRIELGLKYHNTERTKNGYFVGFNATYDPRIRNKECNDSGFDDVRRHQGARRVRLTDLMEENKGKLNVNMALKLIADHYDVYLKKENLCSRTVCSHYELDGREYMSDPSRPKPFQPRGALDGCVANSKMIKNMSFLGRFGASCGKPFIVSEFCDKNRQWAYLKDYLHDRPTQPWTEFSITDFNSSSSHKSSHKKNKSNKKYGGRGQRQRQRKTKKYLKNNKNNKNKNQRGGEDGTDQGDTCFLCRERIADTSVFNCVNNHYHYYCGPCIFDYISSQILHHHNTNCPVCRGPINDENFDTLSQTLGIANPAVFVIPNFIPNAYEDPNIVREMIDFHNMNMREMRENALETVIRRGFISLMITAPFVIHIGSTLDNILVPSTIIIGTGIYCYYLSHRRYPEIFLPPNPIGGAGINGSEKIIKNDLMNIIEIPINGPYDKTSFYNKLLEMKKQDDSINLENGILILDTLEKNTEENVVRIKKMLIK